MAAAPARVVCGDCGSTVPWHELHLPCDVCRSMKRGIFEEFSYSKVARPTAFAATSQREYGPELPPEWQARILDELHEDWTRATENTGFRR